MANMPFVSNASIFSIMTDWLADNAPFVTARFYNVVSGSARLDQALFVSINGDEDQQHDAFRTLIIELWETVDECLSLAMYDELACHTQTAVAHMEVAQASMLESWEEQEVWAQWERLDAQQAEQDKFDMYYNEY